MAGCGLMLAFGGLNADDAEKVEVGSLIKSLLEKAGFEVEWNGDPAKRIAIPRLDWKRRAVT